MEKSTYKTVNLFGEEELHFINKKQESKKTLFDDYNSFIDKFKAKKTTDDCYTPDAVYKVILDYVHEKINLTEKQIIRPFVPGGDFESIEYSENCVVVDNPPFSIITKICKYYIENNVKFFLFCPHLTAFSSDIDVTYIITNSEIIYENGAQVMTAFVSNLFDDLKIIGEPDLSNKIKEAQGKTKISLPKYKYSKNILTVSKIAYCVAKGVSLSINKKDVKFIRKMDAQKKHKKGIFGSGFLISDKASEILSKAEELAKNKENSNFSETAEDGFIFWELSEKEKETIKELNKN